MELFQNKIVHLDSNSTFAKFCNDTRLNGSDFARYIKKNSCCKNASDIVCMFRDEYCRNNFNDYLSSLIVLFELTVVNQWHGKRDQNFNAKYHKFSLLIRYTK